MTSGLVTGTHRRHFEVELPGGEALLCATKGRQLSPACGDIVDLERQGGRDGVITAIHPRKSELTRADAYRQKTIAANVTLVIGVVAVEPAFNPELVDRWTVSAESQHCRFALVLNKTDLPDADRVRASLALYETLGYSLIALSAKRDIGPLRALVAGEQSVVIGQSGMGKSTIINALTGTSRAKTGDISTALNAGRHTTTSTQLHRIDPATWIVDSPGMKEFGVHQLKDAGLDHAFVEMRPHLGNCRFRNCVHDTEPGCAVREAAERGDIAPRRFETYHRLRRELDD
jgi:ribosome biogenesis GTPase